MIKYKQRYFRKVLYCILTIAANGIMDTCQAGGLIAWLEIIIETYATYIYRLHFLPFFKKRYYEDDTEIFGAIPNMEDTDCTYPADDTL